MLVQSQQVINRTGKINAAGWTVIVLAIVLLIVGGQRALR
jgi:hypothetical protein